MSEIKKSELIPDCYFVITKDGQRTALAWFGGPGAEQRARAYLASKQKPHPMRGGIR